MATRTASALRILSMVAIATLCAVGWDESRPPPTVAGATGLEALSPAELARRLSDEKVVLVSLDDPRDFQAHRIAGSIRGADGLSPADAARVGEARLAVLYWSCCTARAVRRARSLREAVPEARLAFLAGGLAAWARAGHPVDGEDAGSLAGRLAYESVAEAIVLDTALVRSELELADLEAELEAAPDGPRRLELEERVRAFHGRRRAEGARLKENLRTGSPR